MPTSVLSGYVHKENKNTLGAACTFVYGRIEFFKLIEKSVYTASANYPKSIRKDKP